jgi:parallel beta-helix repeat protein
VPKTGNTYTGKYGAVLDGTGGTWLAGKGIFQAHNQNIDNVTIRNLVLRDADRGVNAFKDNSSGWVVDNCEVAFNFDGVAMPSNSVVSDSVIHDNKQIPSDPTPANRGGGYTCHRCVNTTFVNNEFYNNGPESKITNATGVVFRGNFVHDVPNGIWYDGDNTNFLVENNIVLRSTGAGIIFEISGPGIARNNVVENSAGAGFLVAMSKNIEIHNNTMRNNGWGGVNLFFNPSILGGGVIGWDLSGNSIHDNTFVNDAIAFQNKAGPEYYRGDGTKGNRFVNNTYDVPDRSGRYWAYGGADRTFAEWQAIGQDITGSA